MLHYLLQLNEIYVVYWFHMQKKGTVVNGRSTACHKLKLVLDLNEQVLEILVLLSNSSTHLPLFCFRTSVDIFLILFNCSISINSPYLWKTWLLWKICLWKLLKCLHASIVYGFFVSFLCLFNLMWKGFSGFPIYCISQSRHSNK